MTPPTLHHAIKAFLSNLQKEDDKKNHTHKAYKYDLLGKSGLIKSTGLSLRSPIESLTIQHVTDYLQMQVDSDMKVPTRRRRASACKEFLKFLAFKYDAHYNIEKLETAIKILRLFKGKENIIYFPEEKIKRILDYTLTMKIAGIEDLRDISFIRLGAECGLRVSDVESARIGDIKVLIGKDKKEHLILTVIGKGDKQASLRLGANSRHFIKKYLKAREGIDSLMGVNRAELPLFSRHDSKVGFIPNTKHLRIKKINVNLVEKSVHRIAYLALGKDYDDRITYHKLRHYFGTMAYRHRKDIKTTQEMMRHAKGETTLRYTHLEENAAIDTSVEIFG